MEMSERSTITIIVIVIAILAVSSLMFWGTGFGMMGPGMMGWWGGGFWWMPLMMILFLALIAFGIYFLVRSTMPVRRGAVVREEPDRALAIARERLARGEITQEEFERIKKSLSE